MNIDGEFLELFTQQARRVLVGAQKRTRGEVTSWDVLVSLLENGGPGVWRESLKSIGVAQEDVYDRIVRPTLLFKRQAYAYKALELGRRESARLGQTYTSCEALLLGLIDQGDRFSGQVLIELGANLERMRSEVERLLQRKADQFRCNITQAAIDDRLAPVIGRDREIERILHILFRDPSHIPVLVGPHGIGKTAIVHGLAQRIATNKVPREFAGTQVTQLDLAAAARALDTSEFYNFISTTLTRQEGLMFLDDNELQEISLKPEYGESRIISAMTPEIYSRMAHDLERTLMPVKVDEVSVEQTVLILEGLLQRGEKRYQLPVTSEAIGAAAWYAREGLEAPVPGSAIELLDEAASLGELRGLDTIDEKTVAEAVASMLGIEPEDVEEAPRVQARTAKVEHNPEIWEMS